MTKPAPKALSRIDAHVGARLQELRKEHDMAREALGKHLGIGSIEVLKHELGFVRIGAMRLFEIARLLDVPVATFFEGLL